MDGLWKFSHAAEQRSHGIGTTTGSLFIERKQETWNSECLWKISIEIKGNIIP